MASVIVMGFIVRTGDRGITLVISSMTGLGGNELAVVPDICEKPLTSDCV